MSTLKNTLNKGVIPKIASRYAVFAKTDLIHAQQEGYTLDEICNGLSHGLAKNIIDTLFNNSLPCGPVIFCGGVKAVVKHISLFAQTAPSLCCPSLVTEAMADEIERITGIPVVTLEYDDTGGFKNDDVIPYLKYPRKSHMPLSPNAENSISTKAI